jgi:hypothetical protein
MYEEVVILNGPITESGISQYERFRVKARPLGRTYYWSNGSLTNGGFKIVYEAVDGSIYIQEIEWEMDKNPSPQTNPQTYYYYEVYPSLAEARAKRGWLIQYVLGNDNPFS